MEQLAIKCERTADIQRLSRISAAQQQLEGSIAEMFLGNWACSITLAGAAEGMLPEPTEQKDVYAAYKEHAIDSLKLERREAIRQLNDKRDWLKHNQRDNPRDEMSFDQLDAIVMIFRAYSRFVISTKAKSNMIGTFEVWIQKHYPEWLGKTAEGAKA